MSEPIDELKRYAENLAGAVAPTRSRVVAMRAIARAQRRPRRSALRVAAATAGFFAIANVAAAAVADPAVPGDTLYPLDRAYERVADLVGLGEDRTEERLGEAAVLVDRSRLEEAVDLVAESIDDQTVVAAANAFQLAGGADADLQAAVDELIAGAHAIATAAREGDRSALDDARGDMRELAANVARAGGGQNDGVGPGGQGNTGDTGAPDDVPGVTAPGQDDTPPGQGNQPPGQDGDPPGQGNEPPGQGGDPPGQGGEGNPGDTAPGSNQENPGDTASGQGEDNPGDTAPGQGGSPPGGGGGSGGSGNSSGRP